MHCIKHMIQPTVSQEKNLNQYFLIILGLLAPIISLILPLNISWIIKLAIGYIFVVFGYILGYLIAKVVKTFDREIPEQPVKVIPEQPIKVTSDGPTMIPRALSRNLVK